MLLILSEEDDGPCFHPRLNRRGTPAGLESFKDYSTKHELYAIGFILNYIFTGRKEIQTNHIYLLMIINQCINQDISKRYDKITQLIEEVEHLDKI